MRFGKLEDYIAIKPDENSLRYLCGYEGKIPVVGMDQDNIFGGVVALQIVLANDEGDKILYLHKSIVYDIRVRYREGIDDVDNYEPLKRFLNSDQRKKEYEEAFQPEPDHLAGRSFSKK